MSLSLQPFPPFTSEALGLSHRFRMDYLAWLRSGRMSPSRKCDLVMLIVLVMLVACTILDVSQGCQLDVPDI